jgi:uncharacterized membrane protein
LAGIGWKLEELLDRDSLASKMSVFLTGAAVTSGPWLLTTLVLVLMRISSARTGTPGIADAERIITIVYAGVIVLGAPVDIMLSRYAADRVYEHRRDQIAAPLRRVLAGCLVSFLVLGAIAMRFAGVSLELAVAGAALSAIVGGQWLLLSAAGGLSSPGIILRAFAFGAPSSVIGVLVLARPDVMGSSGYLYGFAAGQLVTLALLLWGTLQALPLEEDENAKIWEAFQDYWLLAAAAIAFHSGLWVDKLVVYLLAGGDLASRYSSMAAIAWLSVVPACAYLFVTVETVFHRRFRAFYSALHTGSSLSELEQLAVDVRAEVSLTLRGTAAVQAGATLLCLLLAPSVAAALHLSDGSVPILRWLLVGAALQVLAVAATLLLYYFDFRREAFIAALVQLGASGALTFLIGAPSSALGAGYAAACALTCITGITLLQMRMSRLLEHTFLSQPYATET